RFSALAAMRSRLTGPEFSLRYTKSSCHSDVKKILTFFQKRRRNAILTNIHFLKRITGFIHLFILMERQHVAKENLEFCSPFACHKHYLSDGCI
ncbi:hypothetical protein MK280_02785, partial [Myxococcota bacterium]|nr:hypothetical protein [Myxococcota bacterium]